MDGTHRLSNKISSCGGERLTNVYRERENADACLWRSTKTNRCLTPLLSTVAVKRARTHDSLLGRQAFSYLLLASFKMALQ